MYLVPTVKPLLVYCHFHFSSALVILSHYSDSDALSDIFNTTKNSIIYYCRLCKISYFGGNKMKLKNIVIASVATLSFGAALTMTSKSVSAYSSYKSIPTAIRGYYISKPGNDSLKITKHAIVSGSPLADSYFYRVTKVNRSGHKYHVHAHITLGNTTYFTMKLSHYKKNKIYSAGYTYTKTSKAKYHYFSNHFNHAYGY